MNHTNNNDGNSSWYIHKVNVILAACASLMVVAAGVTIWADRTTDVLPGAKIGHSITGSNPIVEHASYKDRRTPEQYNVMMQRWEACREKVVNDILSSDATVVKDKWTIIPSTDFDIAFANNLPKQESTTFKDAVFSDERNKAIDRGDYLPAILLNDARNRAILTWLKGTGETVAIDIKSKVDEWGSRTWYVDGQARMVK